MYTVPLSVWCIVCLTQRRWAIFALIFLLSTPTFIEDTIGAVCKVPGFPSISSSYICRFVLSRERNLSGVGAPLTPKLDTVQDILVRSFFSKDVTSTDFSMGDMAFLVESSGMGCQDVISGAINQLQAESILLTDNLLELSAETSYHLNL